MITVRKIHGSLINYREEAIRPLRQLLADLAVQDRKKEKKDENGNHLCLPAAIKESCGFWDDNWQDRADYVAGPCGQQHCWLELEDDL